MDVPAQEFDGVTRGPTIDARTGTKRRGRDLATYRELRWLDLDLCPFNNHQETHTP